MSADGRIYITISDTREGEVIKGTKEVAPKKEKEPKPAKPKLDTETKYSTIAMHQFIHFMQNEANQMVQYTLGNIGNFTGDYNTQRQIDFAKSAINVGGSIVVGAMAGGVVGAILAGAGQTINFGLQLHSQNFAIKKQNYNISQLRQLSGLDGLTNGSRI